MNAKIHIINFFINPAIIMFLEQVVCSQLGIQIQTVKCKDLDNYAAGAFDLAI